MQLSRLLIEVKSWLVQIAVTRAFPRPKGELISQCTSKVQPTRWQKVLVLCASLLTRSPPHHQWAFLRWKLSHISAGRPHRHPADIVSHTLVSHASAVDLNEAGADKCSALPEPFCLVFPERKEVTQSWHLNRCDAPLIESLRIRICQDAATVVSPNPRPYQTCYLPMHQVARYQPVDFELRFKIKFKFKFLPLSVLRLLKVV